MKAKCSICKAKSVDKRHYRGKLLCPECHYEYKAIFEGWQSNKSTEAFNNNKGTSVVHWGFIWDGEKLEDMNE
jgi:hypothetical protein